jgi:hypothetical protein
MTPPRQQHADTFGRNTSADLELFRRINDAPKPKSQTFDLVAIIIAAVGVGYSIFQLLNQ